MCTPLDKQKLLSGESSARFLQAAPPQAPMLVVALDSALGNCREQIQMAFPFAALEPLIRQLAQNTEIETAANPAPAPAAPRGWNPGLDEVCIAVTAEWEGLEVAAREVLHLRVGDVLKMDPPSAERVRVRLGEKAKFRGHLGAVAGNWAVELTESVKQ